MLKPAGNAAEKQARVTLHTKAPGESVNERPFQRVDHAIGARCAFTPQAVAGFRIHCGLIGEIKAQPAQNIGLRFRNILPGDGFAESSGCIERGLMLQPVRQGVEAQCRLVQDGARSVGTVIAVRCGLDALFQRWFQNERTGPDTDRRIGVGFRCETASLSWPRAQVFALCSHSVVIRENSADADIV